LKQARLVGRLTDPRSRRSRSFSNVSDTGLPEAKATRSRAPSRLPRRRTSPVSPRRKSIRSRTATSRSRST